MACPRLLLIEDDQKLCRLLKDYLEPLGYEVEAVHDGAVGLARAREETYGIAADLLSFDGGAAAGE